MSRGGRKRRVYGVRLRVRKSPAMTAGLMSLVDVFRLIFCH